MTATQEEQQLDSDQQNEEEEPIAAGDDVIDANDESPNERQSIGQNNPEMQQHMEQQQIAQQQQPQHPLDAQQEYEQMDYKICGELMERNKALDEFALAQDANGLIQVRIQQLALCKLLVNIHKKDLFILVTAYTKLGEGYLKNRYFEQALDHLTTALKLNGSLFSKIEITKQYHSHILTLLGNCYMEAGNFKDALSLLEKSLKMNKQILGEQHPSNGQIYQVIGQVYLRQKDYERSLNVLADAWELFEMSFGKVSEQVGNCYLEISLVHSRKKDMDEAIRFQKKAFEIFSDIPKFSNTEFLSQIAITLAELQEKAGLFDDALVCLHNAKDILEDNYSLVDKRTCKVKRNISLLYLKSSKYDEALSELKEVEELETTLYGDRSGNLAKTYKVIGTLLILNNMTEEAKEYLLKAQSIFEQRGLAKMLKEVKHKLRLLNQNNRANAANLVAAEIIEGSEYDSQGEGQPILSSGIQTANMQPQLQHQMVAKKKKKASVTKKQKFQQNIAGVKTNNFMD